MKSPFQFGTPLLLAAVLAGYQATAQTTLYVGPLGTDSNPGTSVAAPTTLTRAITAIADGGTIYMLGGTYSYSSGITIAFGNNGTTGKRIEAYQGQVPVLSFASQPVANTNRGFTVNGNRWYIKGLVVERAGDNGIYVGGSYCTFELCTTRYNQDSGFQLGRSSATATRVQWPHDNLVLNCTSHDNQDPDNENADGFACKLTTGANNKFKGCISHHNIDDGWDFYAKTETGPIDPITLEACVSYSNGTLSTGTTSGSGDKNGFKLGGDGIAVAHLVVRCVAFNNGRHGFTDNNNPGPITLVNNTSYNNVVANYNFRAGGTQVFTNNLSFQGGASDSTIGTLVSNSNVFWTNGASSNGQGLVVSAADFVSTSAPALVSRNSNNEPDLGNFLALATGSDLLNAGVVPVIPTNSAPVTYTYNGANPDVGAWEAGSTSTPASFTLTTTASPTAGGTITRSLDASSYAAGTVVTLTAVPAPGYVFSGWSGAATATTVSTAVTVNRNLTVTATFIATSGEGSSTLRIEDAAAFGNGYCAINGARQRTYAGASNGFYVNLSNSIAQGINWSVSVPAAGPYTLRWRYANGSTSSATSASVLVNGAPVVRSVSFPRTTTWTTWTTTTASVSLPAGTSTLRLETTANGEFANIDWIEIVGNRPVAAACSAARLTAPANSPACAHLMEALQLFPNPVTNGTTLTFGLAAQSPVTIRLIDDMGVSVKNLPTQVYGAGTHTISLSSAGLKPGYYLLLVVSNQGRQTLRMEVR